MIKPHPARVVLFQPSHYEGHPDQVQPYAAIVCYVHSDRLVNLCAFTENGHPFSATSVPLLQDDDKPLSTGYYAYWMDYQKGQAAKTESMERELLARIEALERGFGNSERERQQISASDVGDAGRVLGALGAEANADIRKTLGT